MTGNLLISVSLFLSVMRIAQAKLIGYCSIRIRCQICDITHVVQMSGICDWIIVIYNLFFLIGIVVFIRKIYIRMITVCLNRCRILCTGSLDGTLDIRCIQSEPMEGICSLELEIRVLDLFCLICILQCMKIYRITLRSCLQICRI